MALQVWLPLNGDMKNKGLANVTATPAGGTASYDANGKIGSCLSCNGSTFYNINPINLGSEATIAWWEKTSTAGKVPWTLVTDASSYGMTVWGSSSGFYYTLNTGDGNNDPFKDANNNNVASIQDGNWNHFAVTFGNNVSKLYINGEYAGRAVTFKSPAATNKVIRLAGGSNNAHNYDFNGYLNDFRVYDHCLSRKEVKEISKALIVHYPLHTDTIVGTANVNLVANGNGGSDNWISKDSSHIGTDVPSGTSITNCYMNGNNSIEYIPIIPDHTYSASAWVKKYGSSGCYVSWLPYDIDYNRIYYYNSGGFRANTLTTLSQDLNPGDTKINLTNTANWSGFGTYETIVAIFDYEDSTGYLYPPLNYTRHILGFDNTSVDTTNKQITLSSAYSGKAVPAGTSICVTKYGATYFYSSNTTAANATDWVQLTSTFVPKNTAYIRAARYLRYQCMSPSYNYSAGIELKDTTTNSTIFDVSGYGRDALITTAQYETDITSPRYNNCIQNNTVYPLRTVFDFPQSSGLTIACWVYLTAWGSQTSGLWATSTNSTSSPADYTTTTCNHYDSAFHFKGTNGTQYSLTCGTSRLPKNTWTHVAITHNGSELNLYINGVPIQMQPCPTSLVAFKSFFLGYSYAGGLVRRCQGKWSDFRMYATALSAGDMEELYNTSAVIDDKGDLMCYRGIEQSDNFLRYERTKINLNPANTDTCGKMTTRNGVLAMRFLPTDTWFGTNDERNGKMFYDMFKENTRYVFDMWIDADNVATSSSPANQGGGFNIHYTDGTESYALVVYGANYGDTPMGFQHRVYISEANKTIKRVAIRFAINASIYVRADSFIAEVADTNVYKTGTVATGQFVEGYDVAEIGMADFKENILLEI